MNIAQIEINLQKLITTFNKEDFIYELLLAYGLPKASITRLKKGNLNLSKVEGEISWKKKLYFREEQKEDLHITISKITKELKRNERFVIVTDYKTLLAVDTKTDDKLDCALSDLPKYYDFFLPWSGMEKAQHTNENPADVKAAEKMAKLFDTIKKDNPDDSAEFIHGLNIFLSRLLFCFFAEDTHIFEDSQFTNAIDSHTQPDGSDLNTYLGTLFTVLNTPQNERKNLPEYLKSFPFVNGGLFKDKIPTPNFSRSSRSEILNSGDQNWAAINPDIFGSMFQAVISVDQRESLGQHYTSVPNIMKVIEPLFLNELYEEFEKAGGNRAKLKRLRGRLYNLKIFDPACGSGNFLIIAYKELSILEMKIFKKEGETIPYSGIQLAQFYGIEIDDFAGEIAKLALWLAEHQMNVEFYKEFGRTNPTLPLKEAGKIVKGNATRLDWEKVCPKTNVNGELAEVYILGNPPYLGSRNQDKTQKEDLDCSIKKIKHYRKLDYIAIWFYKAAIYLKESNSQSAFVSTNSICQGEQIGILWNPIFEIGTEICFAYTDFKWINNAKNNAGVTVIIIGLRNISKKPKYLFRDGQVIKTDIISPSLENKKTVCVVKKTKPISLLPEMRRGNMPNDKEFLRISPTERDSLINKYPLVSKIIKRQIGANEYINKQERYCYWISDENLSFSLSIPEVKNAINNCYEYRINSKDKTLHKQALKAHQFREFFECNDNSLLIPIVSSENRDYIPMGFVNKETIVPNSAQVIYDANVSTFGVLTSRMHNIWVKVTAGRLENRFRYSIFLCYNTFPFPPISTQRKNEITQSTFRILEEREKHPEKTLAQLYDPDKMPDGLREAHRQNDEIIEKCYRSTPFKSDEERLEYLFKLYEKMIAEEKEQATLFAKEKKTRKKKK